MDSKTDGSEEPSLPSPHRVSHENLNSSAAEASAAASNDGRRSPPINLSTRVGPPGTVGFQFVDTHGGGSPIEDATARVRKKFKRAVDNVRAANRIQKGSILYTGGVAAEPGLDYRTMDVEGFNSLAEVTVVDYSAKRCSTSKKLRLLEDFQRFFEHDRPKWAKVRWINVDGLNWQCIKLLATKYNLHRLAVEDLLSVQRTKMDLYPNHTYVCLLLHVLIRDDDQIVVSDDDEDSNSTSTWLERPPPSHQSSTWDKIKSLLSRKANPDEMVQDAETAAGIDQLETLPAMPIAQYYHPDRSIIYNQVKSTRKSNLTVAVEQVSIFLTTDGTVITFFQQSGRSVERPIIGRLSDETTILRTSEDASLLLQSVIDAVVDLSFPIATAYQELIADLEIDVLTNPQMQHTRELHIVSGELNILKRTLYPLYNMINALRERPKASYFCGPGGGGLGNDTPEQMHSSSQSEEKGHGAEISSSARVYLADVADHVLILTEEVDMLRGTVENMINMIFNIVAATQNESMRQLTMANLIFLPLTFITGYFGMNFNQEYWQVMQQNGPIYFWKIAIPTTVLVMLLLAFSYIIRLFKMVKRRVVGQGVRIKLRKSREMRRHRGTGVLRARSGKIGPQM